jgi:hypothetical protein
MAGYLFTRDPLQSAAYGAVSASFIVESLGARRPPHFKETIALQRLNNLLHNLPPAEILP